MNHLKAEWILSYYKSTISLVFTSQMMISGKIVLHTLIILKGKFELHQSFFIWGISKEEL
ncbi:hypothetical protein QTP88_000464, partial [Uroleucon formosanum]